MRVAIDFDGVIFDKSKGCDIPGAVRAIRTIYDQGHEVTVFTNRPDYDYSSVKGLLESYGVPYHRLICGKPSYDVFIDDRSMRFEGWDKEYLK